MHDHDLGMARSMAILGNLCMITTWERGSCA